MPKFSSSKIVTQNFSFDNNGGESGIGYDMIISSDILVNLGLSANFNCRVLQWNGATSRMKVPSVAIRTKEHLHINNLRARGIH